MSTLENPSNPLESAKETSETLVGTLLPEAAVRASLAEFIDIVEPMGENAMTKRLMSGARILADTVLYDIGEYGNSGVTGLDLMTLGPVLGKRRAKFKQELVPRKRKPVPEYPIERKVQYGQYDHDTLIPLLSTAKLRLIPKENLPKDWSGLPEALPEYTASIELSDAGISLPDQHVVTYYPPADPFGMLIVLEGKIEKPEAREQRIAKAALAQTPWHEIRVEDGALSITLANQTFYRPQVDAQTPKYVPAYQTVQPDNGMIQAARLSAQVAVGPVAPDWAQLYRDMAEVTVEYALSSGTMAGQVGRMKKGTTMLEEVKAKIKQRSLVPHKHTYQQYKGIISHLWPLEEVDPELKFSTTNLFALDALFRLKGRPLLSINSNAGAGRYYGNGITRETSSYTDYMMATVMLQHCATLDTPEKAMDYYKKKQGMFLPNLKNKMEILPRENITTKSRNYFHFNTFVQLPAQVLFSHFQKKKGKYQPKSTTNPKTYSLFGWAPQNGGLQDLLKVMSRETMLIGHSIAVYSDNMWILLKPPGWMAGKPFVWFSLDGSSMESSNTRETMYLLNTLIAERIPMSKAWRNYILYLHPIISTDVYAVLGKAAILQPGLASGTSATAQNNHSLMMMCAHYVNQVLTKHGPDRFLKPSGWKSVLNEPTKIIGDSSILHNDIENEFLKMMVSIKVEMYSSSTLFPFLLGQSPPPPPGLIPLDLLGQDATTMVGTWPSMGDIHPIFPVLDRGRLLRASVYDSLSLRWKKESLFTNVVKSMRLKALYTLGGWWYDVLGLLYRQRLSALTPTDLQAAPDEESWKNFQHRIQDLVSDLVEEEVTDQTIAQLMYSALKGMTLPYMMDVVGLNLGKKYANFLCLELLQTNGLEEALRYAGPLELTIVLSRIPRTGDMSWKNPALQAEIDKFIDVVDNSPSEEGFKTVIRRLKDKEGQSALLPLRKELERKKILLVDDDPDPFNFFERTKRGTSIPDEELSVKFDDIDFGPTPKFVSLKDWQEIRTKIPKPPKRPMKMPALPGLENAILREASHVESFLYGTESLTAKLERVGFRPKGPVPPQLMGYLATFIERALKVGRLLHEKAPVAALGDFMIKETRLARKASKKAEKAEKLEKKTTRLAREAAERKEEQYSLREGKTFAQRRQKASQPDELVEPESAPAPVFQIPPATLEKAMSLLRKNRKPPSLSPEQTVISKRHKDNLALATIRPVESEAAVIKKFLDSGLVSILDTFPENEGHAVRYLTSLWAIVSDLASGGRDTDAIVYAHFP